MTHTSDENSKNFRLDKISCALIGLFTGIFLFMPITIGMYFLTDYVIRDFLNLRFPYSSIDDS